MNREEMLKCILKMEQRQDSKFLKNRGKYEQIRKLAKNGNPNEEMDDMKIYHIFHSKE